MIARIPYTLPGLRAMPYPEHCLFTSSYCNLSILLQRPLLTYRAHRTCSLVAYLFPIRHNLFQPNFLLLTAFYNFTAGPLTARPRLCVSVVRLLRPFAGSNRPDSSSKHSTLHEL